MSKILITGGAGFVGYHLSKRLTGNGNEVVIASNVTPDTDDEEFTSLLAQPNVRIIQADLTNEKSWDMLGSGYDFVYHLVSINGFKQFVEIPQEVLRVGITTTLNAIDWLRRKNGNPKAKILYTSSNEVYAGASLTFGELPLPTPENVPLVIHDTYDPRWSYGGQKLFCELLLIHFSKAYDFRMVIVRPHNIYGPKAGYSPLIPKLIERTLSHIEPFPIFDAEEHRSSVYVEDVVEGMVGAMESSKTDGEIYHIGADRETTVRELAKTIFGVVGWEPKKLAIQNSPKSSSKHCLPDISKLKKDTGWEPRFSLEEGLRKTIAWYTAHPKT